jgi:septal ring factor EnvC (AmiA/AmiB activator)
MNDSLGKLIDKYIDRKSIECLYLYRDKNQEPHIVLTESESEWEYTEIFSENINLSDDIDKKKKKVKALEEKIRQLERSKKEVEKAIKLLRNNL